MEMPVYKCIECGVNFSSYNKNPKFCSLKCKGDNQAPDINIEKLRELYESGMTQHEVAENLGVSQKSVFKAMRRNGIRARVAAKRDQWGANNDSWKGDGASYAAFHRRLYSIFGKPYKCGVCGTDDENRSYDYANLTGNYHDIEDYMPMCRSCHWKYDGTIKNIKKMRNKV